MRCPKCQGHAGYNLAEECNYCVNCGWRETLPIPEATCHAITKNGKCIRKPMKQSVYCQWCHRNYSYRREEDGRFTEGDHESLERRHAE